MSSRNPAFVILLLVIASTYVAQAEDAPRIVSTEPAAWAKGVPINVSAIKIVFDRPMRPGFSALTGRSSLSPEFSASVKLSPDGLVFTVPVKLEAGKVYMLSLNEGARANIGFQDRKGISAPPYYLAFQTEGEPAKKPPQVKEVRITRSAGDKVPQELTLKVQYDQAMDPKSQGFVVSDDEGAIKVEEKDAVYDKKASTWKLTVRPRRGDVSVSLNDETNVGFCSGNRIPAWPEKLVYRFSPSSGESSSKTTK